MNYGLEESMILTEAEYAALNKLWTRAKPFHPSFGHGQIWLVEIADNAWAVAYVNHMRCASTRRDGAGPVHGQRLDT